MSLWGERSAQVGPRQAAITTAPMRAPGDAGRAGWRPVAGRALYWLPVFALMVLFAQVALLGLRPALCEGRRLADAEVALRARWEHDVVLRDEIVAHLRARADPIFLERQRRLRQGAPPPQDAEPAR